TTGSPSRDQPRRSSTGISFARGTGSRGNCATSGQLGGAAEVPLRILRVAHLLRQARQLEVHAARFLERQRGVEEAARLAPQLGLGAEPAEGGQQVGIAVALGEPAL